MKHRENAKTRYCKKVKYVRVDFYLKDEEMWNYIMYLRDTGVSIQGELKRYIAKKLENDLEYSEFLSQKLDII